MPVLCSKRERKVQHTSGHSQLLHVYGEDVQSRIALLEESSFLYNLLYYEFIYLSRSVIAAGMN